LLETIFVRLGEFNVLNHIILVPTVNVIVPKNEKRFVRIGVMAHRHVEVDHAASTQVKSPKP
jgi:hypothetical protein